MVVRLSFFYRIKKMVDTKVKRTYKLERWAKDYLLKKAVDSYDARTYYQCCSWYQTYLFGYDYLAEVVAGTGNFLVDGILYITVNFVGESTRKIILQSIA